MANITSSRGYTTSSRTSVPVSAFYAVFTGDFGEQAPAAPSLTYEAGSGSLATGTAYVEVTWITQEGVSLPSAQAAVAISASTGAVQVTQPTVPTNGEAVIGWQIFSSGTSGSEELNTVAASSTPAPVSISTNQGNVTGYKVATTSVLVGVYGTGAVPPTIDQSGVQPALPSIAANHSADYYFIVPNASSKWKNYNPVEVTRPDSVTETTGIMLSLPLECQSPLYPGATPGSSTYTQVSVAPGTYMVMGGNLFISNQVGSQNIAATFVGSAAFQVAKGTVVTDGSVTWLCLGKATLVHARFSNILSGGNPIAPTAMEYDLMEF